MNIREKIKEFFKHNKVQTDIIPRLPYKPKKPKTLGDKQKIFSHLLADLVLFAYDDGYQITFGEVYRSPEEAGRLSLMGLGIKNSLHTQRLAADLNLFKDEKYLTASDDYEPLGVFWESLSGDGFECCWGGRFVKVDGNHFSIAYQGRK